MTKYKTRSDLVVIDAVQLVEGNEETILEFMRKTNCPFELIGKLKIAIANPDKPLIIDEGNWLILGTSGDFFALSDAEFNTTYEPYSNFPKD